MTAASGGSILLKLPYTFRKESGNNATITENLLLSHYDPDAHKKLHLITLDVGPGGVIASLLAKKQ
jgi:hypothetical protein